MLDTLEKHFRDNPENKFIKGDEMVLTDLCVGSFYLDMKYGIEKELEDIF